MIFKQLKFKDVYLIEIEKNEDRRGFFARTYCKNEFKKHNIDFNIVQTSISYNKKRGTIRGLHYQVKPYEEAKLIQCIKGSIYDVIIDIRKDSLTYNEFFGINITEKNHKILYIPKGFIHGFQTIENNSIIMYYMDEFYHPECARSLGWRMKCYNNLFEWPIKQVTVSDKDNK